MNAYTSFISPPTSVFRLHFQRNEQTSLRTFVQIYNLSKRPFWFLQISGLLEKRHSLVGGIFVEIGDVVVVDKIVTFLVVKILFAINP